MVFQSFLSLFARLFLIFFFIRTVSLSFLFFVGLPCFVSFPPHHSGSTSIHSSPSLALLFPVVSPPHPLSSLPTFASCTCLSGFCLFIPFSCSLFHLFRHSVPFFTSFCGFSLSTGTHDPITSYCFHLPVSHRLFVLPLDSLSLYTMNPEGFYLFFSLNGFATLPNPSSPSASLSLSITLSLVLSFPLPLHRLHIHILLFCHPISCAPPRPSHLLDHPLTFLSLTLSDMQSLFTLSGALFFFLHSTKAFFLFAFPQQMHTRPTHMWTFKSPEHSPLSAFYHTSNFSSTISRVDAHLQYWQKTHLQKITRPIIVRAYWRLMHHLRVSICLLLIAAHHFGPLPLE